LPFTLLHSLFRRLACKISLHLPSRMLPAEAIISCQSTSKLLQKFPTMPGSNDDPFRLDPLLLPSVLQSTPCISPLLNFFKNFQPCPEAMMTLSATRHFALFLIRWQLQRSPCTENPFFFPSFSSQPGASVHLIPAPASPEICNPARKQ